MIARVHERRIGGALLRVTELPRSRCRVTLWPLTGEALMTVCPHGQVENVVALLIESDAAKCPTCGRFAA
jgi:hypothetical protein